MKKIVFLSLMVAALFSSCGNSAKQKALEAQNDSLSTALSQSNAELEAIMGAFNEVQEGFRLINEAENRVDLQSGTLTEGSADKIKEDIRFISETLKANRERISELERQLKNNRHASEQLKKTLENFTRELAAKQQQIETLQAELASKNIRIAELDDAVAGLNRNVSDLTAENAAKGATIAGQDKALNAAWFVFGTKSELKDQRILVKGEVLKSEDFNKDYFTQVDIRTDKVIKLYSKRAQLLTNHPDGSYELVKDSKGQLTLRILNPTNFWSVSRYLVIQVK